MSENQKTYQDQVNSQVAQYADVENMHAHTPMANWLYDNYTKPRLGLVFGCSFLTEIYAQHLSEAAARTGIERVVSLGAGYGSLEISIMAWVRDHKLHPFHLICTDLSPVLIERTNQNIADSGLSHCMSAQVADLNQPFDLKGPVAGVMVHHALHHFVELEHIFSEIDTLLHPEGIFMTEDMIGRNGHMRWPEALGLAKELWAGLPIGYRRDCIQQRLTPYYQNWDCSVEGFEGIRAQDILPELLTRFRFEKFYANLVLSDIFTGTTYGPNFQLDNPKDLDFIRKVLHLEDALIDQGRIKPVQMFAVMRTLRSTTCPAHPTIFRTRSPEHCVRPVDLIDLGNSPTLAEMRFDNPYGEESMMPPLVAVPLGEHHSFGAGQPGVQALRSGWEPSEEHFTWAWGIASDLEFQAAGQVQAVNLHIIPCYIPGVADQRIGVTVNGKHIGEITIDQEGAFPVSLPLPDPIGSRKRVHIEFARDRPRRPDLDPGDDKRPLSFALISMQLE